MGNRLKWKMGHWEKSTYVSIGQRGYWSKYGDGRKWKEEEPGNWYCQSCNTLQYAFMPSYHIPMIDTEKMRLCALCKHLAIIKDVFDYTDLIDLVRPFGGFRNALANLLTLPIPY